MQVPLTLRQPSTRSQTTPSPPPGPERRGRKPIRDNTRLLLFGVALLIAALAALLALASRSSSLAPDFLTEFVLYALSVTNLTMLVALVFVLARNIVKLVVERRRALPFARFRARLVTVLLGMTLIPAVLVLVVGSELIRNNIDQWFNAPMDNMLSTATDMASDYYEERQRLVSLQAQRFARALRTTDLGAADPAAVREIVAPDVVQERVDLVEVYGVADGAGDHPGVVSIVDVAGQTLPGTYSRSEADRLAERTAVSGADQELVEPLRRGARALRHRGI